MVRIRFAAGVAVAAVAAAGTGAIGDRGRAHADGFYYEEAVGLSAARGHAADALGTSLRLRIGFGMRLGALSIEPWFAGDLAFDRDGATFALFGGAPARGHADLSAMGIDARCTTGRWHHLALFVRGGPRVATGDGTLSGAAGRGLGVGTGLELVGRVRALGFLFAPLFFAHAGPVITGALFLDEGLDAYALDAPAGGVRWTATASTTIGFAAGTAF